VQSTGETGISNSGLIVGHEAAVAVDALMVPSMTRKLVNAIKKTTRKPVEQLINTHHHLDHTGGNTFFRHATIISTEKCREALAPGFPPLPILRRFMPRFGDEFAKLKVVLPTMTFEDRLVIHDGDHEIHLWHPGVTAHTIGDATVFLPKERVLFTGDIAFHYVTPLAFQGHIGNWIKAADRLLTFEADVLVPGHGPVGTKQDLRLMREYLVLVHREARRRFDAGMSAEEAARDIRLGIYASWREAERILPNVMRCYQEFRSQTHLPLDLGAMPEGMERLRGGPAGPACVQRAGVSVVGRHPSAFGSDHRAVGQSFGERVDARFRFRVLGGQVAGDAKPLLDNIKVTERRERFSRAEDAVERTLLARTKERGPVTLSRLRVEIAANAGGIAEASRRVADRKHRLPLTTAQGGAIRVLPRHHGATSVLGRQGLVHPREVRPP